MLLYNKFSEYLKNRYGTKVYKLPVNVPVTCPNRDGRLSRNGCIFCGEEGAGFESLPNFMSVREQIKTNSKYIGLKYKAEKFIAYFQNYTNTYLALSRFKQYVLDACVESVVAVYISTRPDCVNDNYLAFLREVKDKRNVDVVIELGLQTVNYHTLKMLNRGHSLAEFIDAMIRINRYGIDSCAHCIVDLPMDDEGDVIEGAKILSALGVNQVKCHSLYILKDTVLGDMYGSGRVKPISMEEYTERLINFLEYLNPDIVIQRLLGRAPAERSLFCSWDTSWRKIQNMIEQKMKTENRYQGRKFVYLNGKACIDD